MPGDRIKRPYLECCLGGEDAEALKAPPGGSTPDGGPLTSRGGGGGGVLAPARLPARGAGPELVHQALALHDGEYLALVVVPAVTQ